MLISVADNKWFADIAIKKIFLICRVNQNHYKVVEYGVPQGTISETVIILRLSGLFLCLCCDIVGLNKF